MSKFLRRVACVPLASNKRDAHQTAIAPKVKHAGVLELVG
jgi:hypothetical protein